MYNIIVVFGLFCFFWEEKNKAFDLILFEDILVSFSLQRLNCILDHCSYVHGLALLLLC